MGRESGYGRVLTLKEKSPENGDDDNPLTIFFADEFQAGSN